MDARFRTLGPALLVALTTTSPAAAAQIDYSSYVREVARLDLDTGARDVVVRGDHLYVATREGLLVVDASDPLALEVVGSAPADYWVEELAVRGNVLYATDSGTGVRVFDVSRPDSPALLSFLATPPWLHGLALSPETGPAKTLYVAGYDATYLVDVADPTSPVIVGTVPASTHRSMDPRSVDVAFSGGFLYIGNLHIESWVVDVRDPGDPVVVATFSTASSVEIVGDLLYLTRPQGFLEQWDVSDPTDPMRLSSIGPLYSGAYDTAVDGDLVCVANDRRGLSIVALSGTGRARVMGGVPCRADGEATGVDIQDGRAFVSVREEFDDWGAIQVVDLTEPSSPTPRFFIDTGIGGSEDLEVTGNLAYLLTRAGLRILDMSCGEQVGEVWSLGSDQLGLHFPAAYVTTETDYVLHVFDVSDPTQPTLHESLELGHRAQGVDVAGELAFVVGSHSMTVIDVSAPLDPVPLFTTYFPEFYLARSVEVVDGVAYVSSYSPGLALIDVSDVPLFPPTLLSTISVPSFRVRIRDGWAFVAGHQSGLRIVDVSQPSSPALVATVPELDAEDVVLHGGYAYTGGVYSGLGVVDVLDPAAPVVVGGSNTPPDEIHGVRAVRVEGGIVHLACSWSWMLGAGGVAVMPLQSSPRGGPSAPVPVGVAPVVTLEAARPNPFHASTTLTFRLPRPGSATLRIHDVTGRLVREVTREGLAEGRHEWMWDGLDEARRGVAAGVYFVTLETDGSRSARKVAVIR